MIEVALWFFAFLSVIFAGISVFFAVFPFIITIRENNLYKRCKPYRHPEQE